jgi:hypothetical protein
MSTQLNMESVTVTKPFFSDNVEMNVTKRNGNIETVSFDKILNRIKNIGQEVGIQLNYTNLAMKVIDQLYDKISTTKIDELSAEQCASMASIHPDRKSDPWRPFSSRHVGAESCRRVPPVRRVPCRWLCAG